MLAIPARALMGASMGQFISEEEVVRAHERMALMRSGKLDRVEVDGDMRSADGRTMFVHRSITPVFKAGGSIHYYLVMFEDITAKHESEQAALDNLAALERLNRLKSEFMSMVSHEFRTALTGIQGYSEVMTTQEVSTDEVKEFAGDINADALRLNRMITEMLDLDRIESGRMQLHMEPVDLNRMLGDAVDRARMSTRRHDIVTDLDPAVGDVQGDCDRLMQVVSNLLSNAIKYSPNGGEIAVTSKLQDGNMVEVGVRDHGQGIPPEFAQRIFGRYERYEGAGGKDTVGTGLGLAIAQQIVQLHRGRIWVESKLGEGSTFRFLIPAAQSGIRVA
jgi:signal transduction histidine kinase